MSGRCSSVQMKCSFLGGHSSGPSSIAIQGKPRRTNDVASQAERAAIAWLSVTGGRRLLQGLVELQEETRVRLASRLLSLIAGPVPVGFDRDRAGIPLA